MAGDYQHYLQQMLQKGFKRPDGSKNHPSVWEYRESQPPEDFRRIEKVGAEDFFYSPNSYGLFKSLDDKITDWENQRQADVRRWRGFDDGQVVDAQKAASLVGLTGIRTRAVRQVFSNVMDNFLIEFHESVKNPDALFGHINQRSGEIAKRLNEEIERHLGAMPMDPVTGEPMQKELDAVSRMITYALSDCFSIELAKAFREVENLFEDLFAEGPLNVSELHNEALDEFFGKGTLRDNIAKLHWSIAVRQSDNPWVLPDCAILSVDASGNFSPFLLGGMKSRKALILPLSPDRALIGRTELDDNLDISDLDFQAAKCSTEFFLAAKSSYRLAEICTQISKGPQADIESGINTALTAIDPFRPSTGKEDQKFASLENIAVSTHGLSVTEEEINPSARGLGRIIFRLSNRLHLAKLKKIIVCHSVPDAIKELRDVDLGELGKEDFEGVFYKLPYVDDGTISFELYVNIIAFEQILDVESESFDFLLNLFLQTLWQIHSRSILFGDAKDFASLTTMYELPALGLRVANLGLDAAIKCVAIRHAHLVDSLDEETRKHLRDGFSHALMDWQSVELPIEGSAAKSNALSAAMMISCENLFIAAVRYFGVCQAQNIDVFDDLEQDKNCKNCLTEMNLEDWVHRLDIDLRILFANLYIPFDPQKVFNLQSHIERLFWGRGAIIFGYEDGARILPFADKNIDYAKLAEEIGKFASGFMPDNFSDLVKSSTLDALADNK